MNIFEQMKDFDFTTLGELDDDTLFELECIVKDFLYDLKSYTKGILIGNLRLGRVLCESDEIKTIIKENTDLINERLARFGNKSKEYYKNCDSAMEDVFSKIIGFDYIVVNEVADKWLVLYISEAFVLGKGGDYPDTVVYIKFDKMKEIR